MRDRGNRSKSKSKSKTSKESQELGDALIEAARIQNLKQVQQLISQGADVNHVQYKNADCWYGGNTHTALYEAVHSNFTKDGAQTYISILQILLENGADPQFKARRGGWNGSSQRPLLGNISYTITKMAKTETIIRFLKLMAKYGVDMNQYEHHSSGKQWANSSSNNCLIFQLLNYCGMSSKIKQLKSLYQTVNIYQLQAQKSKDLRQKFNQQFNIQPQVVNHHYNPHAQVQQKCELSPQIIKTLIQLGADVNSGAGHYYLNNHKLRSHRYDNGDRQYRQIVKYFQSKNRVRESTLHRAIMNNMYYMVKFLIQKGAKIESECQFTIQLPFYPHEWPEQLKQYLIKQNQLQFSKNEKIKQGYQLQLKNCTNTQQAQRLKISIIDNEYRIYAAKNFTIQSSSPMIKHEIIKLNCLQLAQKINANNQIIELLKKGNHEQKQESFSQKQKKTKKIYKQSVKERDSSHLKKGKQAKKIKDY